MRVVKWLALGLAVGVGILATQGQDDFDLDALFEGLDEDFAVVEEPAAEPAPAPTPAPEPAAQPVVEPAPAPQPEPAPAATPAPADDFPADDDWLSEFADDVLLDPNAEALPPAAAPEPDAAPQPEPTPAAEMEPSEAEPMVEAPAVVEPEPVIMAEPEPMPEPIPAVEPPMMEAEMTPEPMPEPMVEAEPVEPPVVDDLLFDEPMVEAPVEPEIVAEPAPEPMIEAELEPVPEPMPEPTVEAEPAPMDADWQVEPESMFAEEVEPTIETEPETTPSWAQEEPVWQVEEPPMAEVAEPVEEPMVDLAPMPEPEPMVEAEPEMVEPPGLWDEPAATEVAEQPAPAETPSWMQPVPAGWGDQPQAVAAPMPEPEPAVEPMRTAEAAELTEAEQLARDVATQERIRRQEAEISGLKSLDEGFKALEASRYAAAETAFEAALKNIPERPATVDLLRRAEWGLAESHYRQAQAILSEDGDLGEAARHIDEALAISPEHRGVGLLQRRLARAQARALAAAARPVPVDERPEIVAEQREIDELMREGMAYYAAGELVRAEAMFESILVQDEYHIDAMRYLRRIAEDKRTASDTLRETTTEQMMQQVRDAWNPPRRDAVVLPADVRGPEPTDLVTPSRRLAEKMESIVVPRIEFRQANIRDVISFLRDASEAADPDGGGVNIILNMSMPDGAAAEPAPAAAEDDIWGEPAADDPWGSASSAAPMAMGGASSVNTITLNLRRISLMEAIRYITEVAGLRYRIEDNVVVITPAGVADVGRVVTRLYPVQPSFLDIVSERQVETEPTGFGEFGTRPPPAAGGATDVKAFFEGAGVAFPMGTSISYNPAISQLIVANTPENLEKFERILSQLNVVPSQVEIEARFVEVAEDDMREIGLEWLFTDNYEFLSRNNGGVTERIQVDAGNISRGNRFFASTDSGEMNRIAAGNAAANYVGNIMSISSILTNPELQVVLHAIDQNGNTDVLSAPRVTTRSGERATIEVVREIIYPSAFRQEVTENEIFNPETGASLGTRTFVNVTPEDFVTRKVGVLLNVTPTVGPDGYTINLDLRPEVAELADWIQYGSVRLGEVVNIPQPVFTSRNVDTKIVIWDGQTVVMGGLIKESLVTINDKIPLLGDIPILGRLFRSEGSQSRKENLLIFVTARLVDPAGKPIHRAEAMTMPGQSAAAE
jgi:general secretion pathway protein D